MPTACLFFSLSLLLPSYLPHDLLLSFPFGQSLVVVMGKEGRTRQSLEERTFPFFFLSSLSFIPLPFSTAQRKEGTGRGRVEGKGRKWLMVGKGSLLSIVLPYAFLSLGQP